MVSGRFIAAEFMTSPTGDAIFRRAGPRPATGFAMQIAKISNPHCARKNF